MHLILLTPFTPLPGENDSILNLFENGLQELQINRPGWNDEQKNKFAESFPVTFRNRINDHANELKFHSIEELQNYQKPFKRAFLSPVFDSISKSGYKSLYKMSDKQFRQGLKGLISGKNIIALGGIDEHNIEWCREAGFESLAVLGAVWSDSDPVKKLSRLLNAASFG